MSEELLHHSQVCPTVEQMRREAVPEGVRVGRPGGAAVDDAPNITSAQTLATMVAEQRITRM